MHNPPKVMFLVGLSAGLFASLTLTSVSAAQIIPSNAGSAAPPTAGTNSSAHSILSPTITVSAASRRSFETAFATISQQAKVTIIAEGVPFHATLTDEQLKPLNESLPSDTPAPLAETVTTIAAAFDYAAEQTDDYTFLLRKRYSDENDLPCVTYGEIVHALHEVLKITDTYAIAEPHFGMPVSDKYYYSLTAEQKERSKDGLSFADLTPEQRELAVTTTGEACVVNNSVMLYQVYHHLVALKDPRTVFTWMTTLLNKEAFGYRGPIGSLGRTGIAPLDNRFRIESGAYERTVKRMQVPASADGSTITFVDAPEAEQEPDPTTPTELDRQLAAGMLVNRLPSTLTLAEAAQAIVSREVPKISSLDAKASSTVPDSMPSGSLSSSTLLRINVSADLAEKPVCLFGATYSTADHLIRSLRALYDLELLIPKAGRYALVLPIARTPQTREDFPGEVKRLIPGPLLRQYAGLSVALSAASPDGGGALMALKAGYYPAVHRLLVLAKPAVPTHDSPPVRVTQVNPEVLRLIALMLYGPCRASLNRLVATALPLCVFDPDRLSIKLTEYDAKPDKTGYVDKTLYYTFGYKEADGTFHTERQMMTRLMRQTSP